MLCKGNFYHSIYIVLQYIFTYALVWLPGVNLSLKNQLPYFVFLKQIETNVCWNQSSYAMNVPLTFITFFAKVTILK